MRILVAEPKWTGHHLFFARDVATALAATGHEVILAVTASDTESPRRLAGLATTGLAEARIEVRRTLAGPEGGFSRIDDRCGALEVDSVSREILDTRPDRVVLPSGDAAAFLLGGGAPAHDLLRSEGAHLVLHQPYVGYGGRGIRFALRRRHIQGRLRRNKARLAAIDHRISDAMGPRHPVSLLPAHATPPIDVTKDEARRRFDIDHDRPVFLAAGEHSDRKGTDRLIDAWPSKTDGTLLVVGRCSEGVRSRIATRRADLDAGRIRVFDGTVDDETYAAAFKACDVVTVCYPRHFGASGILCSAAQAGTPILGSDYGYVGDCIRSFGLGTTIDCRDPEALAAGLAEGLRDAPELDPIRSRPYREFHTPESFRRHVQMLVLGRTSDGIDPPPAPHP